MFKKYLDCVYAYVWSKSQEFLKNRVLLYYSQCYDTKYKCLMLFTMQINSKSIWHCFRYIPLGRSIDRTGTWNVWFSPGRDVATACPTWSCSNSWSVPRPPWSAAPRRRSSRHVRWRCAACSANSCGSWWRTADTVRASWPTSRRCLPRKAPPLRTRWRPSRNNSDVTIPRLCRPSCCSAPSSANPPAVNKRPNDATEHKMQTQRKSVYFTHAKQK